MNALRTKSEYSREHFVAELADAALEEASRLGVGGASVEQEVAFWKALVPVVAGCVATQRAGQSVECNRSSADDFLAALAEAAYEVSLGYGYRDSFLDLQLGLWNAFRQVIRRNPRARNFLRSLCTSVEPGDSCDPPTVCRGYALT